MYRVNLINALAAMLLCAACQKPTKTEGKEAAAKLAEALPSGKPVASAVAPNKGADEEARDELLGEQLNAYIECGNYFTERVYQSRSRYLDWCNAKTGPTGKERVVYGLYKLNDSNSCADAVTKVKGKVPSLLPLEKAATWYLAALAKLEPLTKQADDYYTQEDYKDDKMAKGRVLHPQLIAAWDEFEKAETELKRLVTEQNDALHARSLTRLEKSEGRSVRFLSGSAMILAKKLVADRNNDLKKIDLERLTSDIEKFEKVVVELDENLGKNKDNASTYREFIRDAKSFLKSAKALMRRVRDKVPYSTGEKMNLGGSSEWMVDGSPGQLTRQFNDLVEASNRIRD